LVFLRFCCVFVSETEFHHQECLLFVHILCFVVRCRAAAPAGRCALLLPTIHRIMGGRRPLRLSGKRQLFSVSGAGAGGVPSVGRSVGLVLSAITPPSTTSCALFCKSKSLLRRRLVVTQGLSIVPTKASAERHFKFFIHIHSPQPSN